jgi:hypothetical protein
MSDVFEDVHLEWKNSRYSIPADRVMTTLRMVERVITYKELLEFRARETVPFSIVSEAYAVMLRCAGVQGVTGDEVYNNLMGDVAAAAAGGKPGSQIVTAAIEGLLAMMTPPATIAKMLAAQQKSPPPGNPNRQQRRAAGRLSRKRSS